MDSPILKVLINDLMRSTSKRIVELQNTGQFAEDEEEETDLVLDYLILENARINRIGQPSYYEESVPSLSDIAFLKQFNIERKTFYKIVELLETVEVPLSNAAKLAIPLAKKCLLTIVYLTTQKPYPYISQMFNVAESAVHLSINTILSRLLQLSDSVICWPKSEELDAYASEFENISSSANCHGFQDLIGIIGACDIEMLRNLNKKTHSFAKKRFTKVRLQAVCSAKCLFTHVFVDAPKSNVDMLAASEIGQKFVGTEYHLLGDMGYPLTEWLMVPYSHNNHLTLVQKRYNNAHNKARKKIHLSFAMLKARWGRLTQITSISFEKVNAIIIACCVLHNICIMEGDLYPFRRRIKLGMKADEVSSNEKPTVEAIRKRYNIKQSFL